MIICSCNTFSDHSVRGCRTGQGVTRTSDVYRLLGCSPQCGRCAGTIKSILREAQASTSGCGCGGQCSCDTEEMLEAA